MTDAPQPPAKRHVAVHLAPWAPDVDPFRLADNRRWLHYWSVDPVTALRELLDRLGRSPGAVGIRQTPLGDIAIAAKVPGDAYAETAEEVRPLAFVYAGLTEAELKAAREQLAARGWRPSADRWFETPEADAA